MSAFELYHKQGIRQYRVTDIARKKDHKIVIRGIRRTDSLQCPVCGSKNVSTKGWKERVFIGVPSGNLKTEIHLMIPRVHCHHCGCGGSSGDFCVGLVTVYGKDYFDEDSQFEESTEYAGINSRPAFQIGVSLGEMLNGDYTGFRGTISEVQFVTCYENIVDAINALNQHNPHFVFE